MWAPALACALGLALGASAFAQPAGGGGSHGGGGGSPGGSGGSHGGSGGSHGGSGFQGGAHYSSPRAAYYGHSTQRGSASGPHSNANHGRGGFGRGTGGHRGFPGNGGRGGYRGYGGYGWNGFAYGAFFAVLPAYYLSFWWGGVPYYYADNTYYHWNDYVAAYEVVPPPLDDPTDVAAPDAPIRSAAPDPELYAYPQRSQAPEQLGTDRYECHRWAADQTGFDPTRPAGGVAAAEAATRSGAYRRAETACLAGRGYSVR